MRREDLFEPHSPSFKPLEAGGMRLEGEGMILEALFASCTSELVLREERGMRHSLLFSSHPLGGMPRGLGGTRLEAHAERLEILFAPCREHPRSRSGGD